MVNTRRRDLICRKEAASILGEVSKSEVTATKSYGGDLAAEPRAGE